MLTEQYFIFCEQDISKATSEIRNYKLRIVEIEDNSQNVILREFAVDMYKPYLENLCNAFDRLALFYFDCENEKLKDFIIKEHKDNINDIFCKPTIKEIVEKDGLFLNLKKLYKQIGTE